MKCQQCEKPATFHITELTGGEPQELHLCETCAKSYLTQGEPERRRSRPTLANVLAKQLQIGKAAEELAKLDQRACPVCGITFYEFRNQGRLGCPHDYVYFEKGTDAADRQYSWRIAARRQAAARSRGGHRSAHRADPPAAGDGRGEAEGALRTRRANLATRFAG